MQRLKLVLIIASFVLLASAVVGFAVSRRSSEKSPLFRGTVMTTARAAKPLIVRDFPKDGIILRHMADERYRQEAEYMFQSPPELRAATNQYSFVIENTSDKAIIGLSIVFGFPKPGETTYRTSSLRTNALQARLTSANNMVTMLPHSKAGYCFALGKENFDFGKGIHQGIQYIQPEQPTHPNMTGEVRQKLNEGIRAQFVKLDRLLEQCERWEVEVEGALFEDGTFVGTNSRKSFEEMNAKIEGARSIINELSEKVNKGEPYSNLRAHVGKYASTSVEELLKPFGGSIVDANDDPTFNYHFSRKLLADRLARMGESEVIMYIKDGPSRWPKLTRKTSK